METEIEMHLNIWGGRALLFNIDFYKESLE